jgi:uncharacterized membrane protein YeaQ/YmgE (transglycosylase-associated protein family)
LGKNKRPSDEQFCSPIKGLFIGVLLGIIGNFVVTAFFRVSDNMTYINQIVFAASILLLSIILIIIILLIWHKRKEYKE